MTNLKYLSAVLAMAIPVSGFQSTKLTIRGFVLDKDSGKTIPQAKVSSTEAAQEGLSDNEGYFRLRLISTIKPGDSIRMRIEKAGYIPLDQHIVASQEPEKLFLTAVKRSPQGTAETAESIPGELGSEGVFKAAIAVVPEVPRPGEIMTVTVLLTNVTEKPIHNVVVHIEAYRPDDTRLQPVRPQRKQTLPPH